MLSQLIGPNPRTRVCVSEAVEIDAVSRSVATAIKILVLADCGLSSLEGLSQFQFAVEIDLRNNCIADASQLKYLPSACLYSLDLRGNPIEFQRNAIFSSLIHFLPSLRQLNGRNYEFVFHKTKSIGLGSILTKAHALHSQLASTLHKQRKKHQLQNVQLNNERESQQNMVEEQFEVEVSLSNLSNVPLTKSVRSSIGVNNGFKRTPLQIVLNNSSQYEHLPITQPTATFASQREKENQFGFKTLVKTRRTELEMDSSRESNDGLLRASQITTTNEQCMLALAYHHRTVATKTFHTLKSWSLTHKGIPKLKNVQY